MVNTPAPLARITHTPGADQSFDTTATTMTAVDTTNLRAVFLAPPSGRVRVLVNAMADVSSAQSVYFGILDGATTKAIAWAFSVAGSTNRYTCIWYISGLTPGAKCTWDFARKGGGGTVKIWGGPAYGPIIMEMDAL